MPKLTSVGRGGSGGVMTNAILDVLPNGDFVLEADGKLKMNHANFTQALKAGFELKQKFPHLQVKVYEANDRRRRPNKEP